MTDFNILVTKSSEDYELIDSGEGEKLERFGNIVLSRPDPQALWKKNLPKGEWEKADAVFVRDGQNGKWNIKKGMQEKMKGKIIDEIKEDIENKGDSGKNISLAKWVIDFSGLRFLIKPTAFKHTGLFPEQLVNWDWMRRIIQTTSTTSGYGQVAPAGESSLPTGEATKGDLLSPRGRGNQDSCYGTYGHDLTTIEVLNLFGYTGGATLACAQAGAKVTHVDSSKSAITWAKENAELSGLKDKPIRWILDDARSFVTREIKRGKKYDGIIMDPPVFGHGTKKEIWKIEEHFLSLVEDCIQLLVSKKDNTDEHNGELNINPLFFIINGYSAGYSAITYENCLKNLMEKFGGKIEMGELAIEETGQGKRKVRILPCGIFE